MAQAQQATRTPIVHGDGGGSLRRVCDVWGVLNVTPDSFSDGGRHQVPERAVARARAMWAAGAAVIDVGGESTRPRGRAYGEGAVPVSVAEELRRVLPVVERLVDEGMRVSVDTTKPEVARRVLAAGAHIVNDVSNGESGELLEVVAEAGAELVLMHNRGRGECEGPQARYRDVAEESLREVLASAERADAIGVRRERLWIDPGLGFAKEPADSARLLARLNVWCVTGYPVLVGASRKSFLARAAGVPDSAPAERLPASLVAAVAAQAAGARAVRVHDVTETLQALRTAATLSCEARP